MNTFEIRTFKDGRWTTDSRCNSNEEALAVANTLAGDRNIAGVKVVEETYDEDQGLFREKTIFSYFKQDDKVFNPRLQKKKESAGSGASAAPPHHAEAEKGGLDTRAWMLILGLLVSLGGNVGLAMYWGNGNLETAVAGKGRSSGGDLIVYDLPPVTTNYKDATGTKVVKMRLGLELSSQDNVAAVQERLSSIINRVANDLSALDGQDLNSAASLNQLRDALQEGVQKAAGEDAPIEGVLFKEVLVF